MIGRVLEARNLVTCRRLLLQGVAIVGCSDCAPPAPYEKISEVFNLCDFIPTDTDKVRAALGGRTLAARAGNASEFTIACDRRESITALIQSFNASFGAA
jgi:hypothetical protein